MRLIDADALGIDKANREMFENKSYADGWNSAIEILKQAPTIEAEPVVHCKDCMFSRTFMTGNMYCELHQNYEYPVSQDDYCSNGAKMDLEG